MTTMREIFNTFVDPKSQKPLLLKTNKRQDDNIIVGTLSIKGRKYPIINGIPRFVNKSFYNEILSRNKEKQTSISFGCKWNEDCFQQHGKTPHERKRLLNQFIPLLGCSSESQLKELLKKTKRTLNAGCGVAWSEYLFNYNKKTERHCIDLSLSVETAYHNTKHLENVIVSQASIFELPYPDNSFDIVYSNGVIHHTPDAKKAFFSLVRKCRPGGLIGIYIYNVKPFLRELADSKIRQLTTKMSYKQCMEFSKQMTLLGKSLSKIKTPLTIEKDIKLLGVKKGEYDLQKFVYGHFIKCWYSRNRKKELCDLVNQDWYHPFYASHHSKNEVLGWFKKAKIKELKCLQPKGWEHSGYFISGTKN